VADHRVRIILEAVDRGSSSLRNFFANSEKDIKNFQRTAQSTKKDLDAIFTSSGVRGRDPSGRFTSIKKEADDASKSLRSFRRDFRAAVAGTSVGQLVGGISTGLGTEREILKEFDRRKALTKKDLQDRKNAEDEFLHDELQSIRAFHAKELRDFQTGKELEIRAEHDAEKRRLAARAAFLQKIRNLEIESAAKAGDVFPENAGLEARIEELRRLQDVEQSTRDAEINAHKERLRIDKDDALRTARLASRDRRQAIINPNDADLLRQIESEFGHLGRDVDRNDSKLRRFGLTAGRAFGQFRQGIRVARGGLSDLEKETLKNATAAQRFGARLGNAFNQISPFRARTLALISVLQIFGTLVVQLGAALVALASSAIEAGAALGGALLAGASQLLPVVGLLAAAFQRLGAVLDAAKLADKLKLTAADDSKTKVEAIKQASDRLADSRYALVKAAEAVKDSEYDLVQAGIAVKDSMVEQRKAVKDLAEARKQAARDIVDANFEEQEASLALADANLAVLDAKKKLREEEQKSTLDQQNIKDAQAQVKEAQARLAQARAEGDTAEITTALQQLSVAEQDLQQIKAQVDTAKTDARQAKNDVAQAELNQKEAVVRNKRAREDAAKARREGVEGSDRVVAARKNLVDATRAVAQAERQQVLATRALRDSVHGLVVAKREEKDAEVGLTDARSKATSQQKQLQDALGDLSPAERKLFKSIQRIKNIYKENFRPITDIIISAFSRAIDTVSVLLKDPTILRNARALATAIGGSIDKLAHFAVSPEFKRFLNFSIVEAAKNVPKITDGFIDLGRILIRIARAATPIFDKLIDRFVSFLDRLEQRTRDTTGIEKFFKVAGEHLDSWVKFAIALGRVLGLIIKLSAPAGRGILDDFTGALDHIADWLSTHGEQTRKFFANVRVQVRALAIALGGVAKVLFAAFSSDSASQLSIFILNTVIPAFALFLQVLGFIATALNTIFKIPLVGGFAQGALKAFFAFVLITKLFKTFAPLVISLKDNLLALKEAFIALKNSAIAAAALEKLVAVFGAIRNAIIAIGVASRAALFTPPIGVLAIIAALVLAVVLLDRKFHFLRPTLEFLLKTFQKVFNWIKDHWKLLTAILLGPFGLIVIAVIKWHDKIIDLIKGVTDWVRDHWKILLVAILLAPFALGGVIILGIIKFRARLLELIRAIPNLIVKAFEKLPGLLLEIFKKIPGLLAGVLKGLGDVVHKALKRLPIVGRFFGGGQSPEDKAKAEARDNKIIAALPKKARAKANKLRKGGQSLRSVLQQLVDEGLIDQGDVTDLAGRFGAEGILFQEGGKVPGAAGQAVPIIAHAGEWVLNKMQQTKVARNLGMTVEQLQMNLFGTGGKKGSPNTKPTNKAKPYSVPGKFNLVPKEDPDGIVVWFIEMADGAFGQVSARDARKIIDTQGAFIPGYVRRSSHGFNARFKSTAGGFEKARGKVRKQFVSGVRDRGWQGFAKGGVVHNYAMPMLQSFAEGGTVLNQAGFGAPSGNTSTKSIEQNFNVTTQGETDWNYVMRIGALHAEGSYT